MTRLKDAWQSWSISIYIRSCSIAIDESNSSKVLILDSPSPWRFQRVQASDFLHQEASQSIAGFRFHRRFLTQSENSKCSNDILVQIYTVEGTPINPPHVLSALNIPHNPGLRHLPRPTRPFHPNSLVRRSPQRRSRNRIAGVASVKVEHDAGVIHLVQARSGNTIRGGDGSATTDLNVQALRIELSAIGVLRAVKSNDLMADDVVTGLQVTRDGGRGGEVVLDEVVGYPGVAADVGPL